MGLRQRVKMSMDALRGKTFVPLDQALYNYQDLAPKWIRLKDTKDFENAYTYNPVVQSVINIKAKAKANVIWQVKAIDTGELLSEKENDKAVKKAYALMRKPNPLQTSKEFMLHSSVYFDTFGNNFIYANSPFEKVDLLNVSTLINLPTQAISVKLTGKWLDQTELSDIIKEYKLKGAGGTGQIIATYRPDEVLLLNEVNITSEAPNIVGVSKLMALKAAISNIQISLEARNVLMQKRGALGIFTSDRKDATGAYPLLPQEKKEVQEEFDEYGIRKKQYQYIISRFPLKFQRTVMTVAQLMLFEELSSDTILICNSFGVPEILAKNYLKGTTYENQDKSERRLYSGAVIPETESYARGLNDLLKTEQYGIELYPSFDHIAVMQDDEKEKSEVEKNRSATYKEKFIHGACTYNEWRLASGDEAVDWGDVRIVEMTPEDIAIITGTSPATPVTELVEQ